MTYTPTPTETPTLIPTQTPIIAIFAADCSQGFPQFAVVNYGGVPYMTAWQIDLAGVGTVASGIWNAEFGTGSFQNAAAPSWVGIDGIYTLTITQWWDFAAPYLQAQVACAAPTLTATPFYTPTPTETPKEAP
jgi:hypothetical protein